MVKIILMAASALCLIGTTAQAADAGRLSAAPNLEAGYGDARGSVKQVGKGGRGAVCIHHRTMLARHMPIADTAKAWAESKVPCGFQAIRTEKC